MYKEYFKYFFRTLVASDLSSPSQFYPDVVKVEHDGYDDTLKPHTQC